MIDSLIDAIEPYMPAATIVLCIISAALFLRAAWRHEREPQPTGEVYEPKHEDDVPY